MIFGLLRVWKIIHVVARERLDAHFLPLRWRRRADPADRGPALKRALQSLGPIFVKFGQALSTRRDLLSPDLADALAELQDRVEPFDGREARERIARALGGALSEHFAEFSDAPMAAASVAQVHAARLRSGEEVVVKVLRPGIERVLRQDLALMRTLGWLLESLFVDARRLHLCDVVGEFEKNLWNELDLQAEAANGATVRRNFDGSSLLYVPQVYFELSRPNVLVMERIRGIPIGDIAALRRAGVNLPVLARKGVEIFFTQVFRDNFFHADMHPGNIFVDPGNPQDPRYIAIDFGIVGALTDSDRHYLAENLLAFFRRDYRRVAQMHIESGWVPPQTRPHEFEAAIRAVTEPIFGKPLAEISFGLVLLRLFQTARRFDMEVQPQLVLLQKTLLNIEGLGRELYPELNLWETAKPYMERWVSEQKGVHALWRELQNEVPGWSKILPALPRTLDSFLRQQQPASPPASAGGWRVGVWLALLLGVLLLLNDNWRSDEALLLLCVLLLAGLWPGAQQRRGNKS